MVWATVTIGSCETSIYRVKAFAGPMGSLMAVLTNIRVVQYVAEPGILFNTKGLTAP
jgi:hypothetical protein